MRTKGKGMAGKLAKDSFLGLLEMLGMPRGAHLGPSPWDSLWPYLHPFMVHSLSSL